MSDTDEHGPEDIEETRAFESRLGGVVHREYWGRSEHSYGQDHDACVTYCRTPGQRRRGVRCPACYGPVVVRPIEGADIDPAPRRAERFLAWCGGWIGAFADAMLYPFRVGRSHTEALIRDILQEAMAAGLRAEVDGLTDILTVLKGVEGELRAIRKATEVPS